MILPVLKSRKASWGSTFRIGGLVVVVSAVLLAGPVGKAHATASFGAVDLGTLGGQHSRAFGINNSGQVVGWSYAAGEPGSQVVHAFSWTQGSGMVDLGTLGGSGAWSEALMVSASGQVVGLSYDASSVRTFSWTQPGGMIEIGTLGGSYTRPSAVSDSDQVVGASNTGSGEQHGFSWTQAGGIVDLGTLGGGASWATAVNDSGQVVGNSLPAPSYYWHAFSWTPSDGMIDVGTLGGSSSTAYAVNDSGQVFGVSTTSTGEEHAFSWTSAGGMVDLGTLGITYIYAVSRNGQFVGNSYSTGHALSWTHEGGLVDLGTLGGYVSQPSAVNDSGQVVGLSYTAGDNEQHAFSWTRDGGMVDLGTFGGSVSNANAVNDSGQVVGDSSSGGEWPTSHAVLWNPLSYVFHGFFQPVDNDGVFNVATAGKAIPVKFDLSGDQGLAIFAAGYPRSVTIACSGSAAQDTIEQTVTAGSSGLNYDATLNPPVGQYTYIWKTDSAWVGTCRQLQLKLNDGQLYTANFRFTR